MSLTRAAFANCMSKPSAKVKRARLPRWLRVILAVPVTVFCLFIVATIAYGLLTTPEQRARWDAERAAHLKQAERERQKAQRLVDVAPPAEASGPNSLDKMAAVFKGGYTRVQIDDLLSPTMSMYGSPLTEAEYERWGNVLVTLRRSTHPVSEMEMLRCMKAMGPVMKFEPAAAICAVSLQNGL